MDVAGSIALVKVVQAVLLVVAALGLTAYKWPDNAVVTDDAVYDYIVVGAGSAGSIVANRLTENPNVHVLLVEAGGDPPIETAIPAMFAFLPKSTIDWNFVSENDGYSAQYHRNGYLNLPSGKVLGGSSSIHHYYYIRGHANDYESWANATGEDSWSWNNLLPYFKKSENLVDEEILNSSTGQYHGTNGYTVITRELREMPLKYLEAFREAGSKVVDDINTGNTLGYTRPMVLINLPPFL
ncbi:glucose dehydrogenase [FAD, quinone]-like [Pararge aegeria]|uniref:glucose dehydrogenase [FAD, quinone]-like n=1 Tax=Pararge aegeria TaxID=116150 RepID=UPI0019D291DC|nr:glucose dehydrogenase [FAD, quinone]-like [Pararge aegeria]